MSKFLRNLIAGVILLFVGGVSFAQTNIGDFDTLRSWWTGGSNLSNGKLTNNIIFTSDLGAFGSWTSFSIDGLGKKFNGNGNVGFQIAQYQDDDHNRTLIFSNVSFENFNLINNTRLFWGGGAISVEYFSDLSNDKNVAINFNDNISFINNNIISGDEIAVHGGAISLSGNVVATFQESNVEFRNNRAVITDQPSHYEFGGGAISVGGGWRSMPQASFVGSKVNFTSNSTNGSGGAILALPIVFGSSGEIHPESINLKFEDSIVNFTGNSAVQGGAISFYGFRGVARNSAFAEFTNSTVNFTSNISYSKGGAIHIRVETQVNFTGSRISFINNTAGDAGGAIYAFQDSTVAFINSGDIVFRGNKAGGAANDIYLEGSTLILDISEGHKATMDGGIVSRSAEIPYYEQSIIPEITKSGLGELEITGGRTDLRGNFTISGGAVNVKGGTFNANLENFKIESGASLSLQNDSAGEEIQVSNTATINGDLSLDVDFSNGKADKIVGGNITFGTIQINVNGLGDGWKNPIAIVGGNISGSVTLNFPGLNAIKYGGAVGTSSITVIANPAKEATSASDINSAETTDQLLKVETDELAVGESGIAITVNKVLYGEGNALTGEGGDNGITLGTNNTEIEFDDLSIRNFNSAQAISVSDNVKLTIAANKDKVEFSGNAKDLVLADTAQVNIETRNGKNVTFNSGVEGSAAGATIEKNGSAEVVFNGKVDFSGTVNVNNGTAKFGYSDDKNTVGT
ncbi:MAG: hypothetical protein LBQ37_03355 [Elusimicrobiota bacterium]|nr:hypothetical protein [Elusimicrobiota bacterium]